MKCSHPFHHEVNGVKIQLPCGHCTYCKIQHSREWSTRLLHELNYWNDAVFVTLTYDDEHLPRNNELSIPELQNFFKLLRRDLGSRKIKYFACGEYGDRQKIYYSDGCPTLHGRPHYHAIIFGVSGNEKNLLFENWQKCVYERFDVGTVTYDSCRYVADYVMKKYNGEKKLAEYGSIQSPFQLCSQGLGKRFALDNADFIKDNEFFYVHGAKVGIPRYYLKVLGLDLTLDNETKQKSIKSRLSQIKYVPSDIARGVSITGSVSEAVDLLAYEQGLYKQRELNIKSNLARFEKKL